MRKYGWIKQKEDRRDIMFSVPNPLLGALKSVDLRDSWKMPPVYDQGEMGSCTANSLVAAIHFDMLNKRSKSGHTFMPSRLFLYYNERAAEGTVEQDSGANIRDGIKSLKSQGICRETAWQYLESNLYKKPEECCYKQALNCQSLTYKAVNGQSKNEVVAALVMGYPICFGMLVFESLESEAVAKTGVYNPDTEREQCLGGHAVQIVGYDLIHDEYKIRNSWGQSWGDGGYFTAPASLINNREYCSDFWIIETVE